MNKAEVAFGLQQEAQNLAEEAIHELEDFISDDARLVKSTVLLYFNSFLVGLTFFMKIEGP